MKYFFSYIDLLPYFLLSIIMYFVLLTKIFNEKQKNYVIFISLFIFIALRYDVGFDYFMYEKIIRSGDSQRFEFLSKLILDLGTYLNFFPLSFAIFGFLSLFFVKKSFDEFSSNTALSWFAYLGLPFLFPASLSTIRQAVAVSIILYSFSFAFKKKYIKFIFLIFIASLFHSSGLIGFLIYPLSNLKFKRTFLMVILAASFLFSSIFETVLLPNLSQFFPDERFMYYVEHAEDNYKSTTIKFLFYIIAILNLLFYGRLIKVNKLNNIFISISTFGVVIFNILSFEPNSAFRIGGFFMTFWVLIVPSYSQIFSQNFKISQIIVSVFFVMILGIMIYSNISAFLDGSLPKASFVPYKTWFFNIK